jgi:SWI/SNF-related matrix-associated actin-dependent regulator 1 of chromatin subfamily A
MSKITVTKDGARWVARFAFDYATKDVVKAAGFQFDGQTKLWWTSDPTVAAKLSPDAADDANRAVAQSRAVAANVTIPVPQGLRYLPYQIAGISYALARPGVLLADAMGLGKTVESIGVINADPTIKTVLVICPASLKILWRREMTKWLVTPRTIEIANGTFPKSAVVIINYDILVKHRAAIDARQWDLLIIDECHFIKNEKAQRTQAVVGRFSRDPDKCKPGIAARKRLFLTGTPIVNRPAELWTLVSALDPQDMGRNFFYFMKRYTDAVHNGYGWDFSGAANLEELQTRMRAKFMVRRLKSEVLTELPPKTRQIIVLPTNGDAGVVAAEKAAYARHEARVQAAQAAIQAAKLQGNQRAYDVAVQDLRDTQSFAFAEMSRLRHDTAIAKIPYVIEHLNEVLEAEDKVVVYIHHHDIAHALVAAFPGCAVVTGETLVGKRQAEVDRFQNDPACRVFIGSIQAAGVGITLTAARHVVFGELDWVPGNLSQAEDRLHRIGQHNNVLVQHLVFDDSIDARMAHTLIEKQTVIDQALDSPTAKVVAAVPEVPEAAQSVNELLTVPVADTVPF